MRSSAPTLVAKLGRSSARHGWRRPRKLSGRPNRIMAPSPRKLVIDRAMRHHLEHRPGYGNPSAGASPALGAERFAQRGKAGQVDEDDRGIEMHRLEAGHRILGEPSAERRRLELLQQFAHASRSSAPAAGSARVGPLRTGSPAARRRQSANAALSQMPRENAAIIDDRPDREHGRRSRASASVLRRQASRPTSNSVSSHRRDRRQSTRVERSRTNSVTGRQLPGGGRDKLEDPADTGSNGVGKHVAAAGHGHADHDDAVLERCRRDVAIQQARPR